MRARIKCLICGTQYEWCRADYPNDPAWRAMVCSDNCHNIYKILSNEKDPVVAKIKLKKQDLSGLDGYPTAIKDQINQIFGITTAVPEESAPELAPAESEEAPTPTSTPNGNAELKQDAKNALDKLAAMQADREPRVRVQRRPKGHSVN